MRPASLVLLAVFSAAGCRAPAPGPGEGATFVALGRRFPTAAPVVTWHEPPGYDAYATEPRPGEEGPSGPRFRSGRAGARERTLAALRECVDLLVVHYDACGTSARCFRVLHDRRGLSAHFLLDVDGTVYQTLDLADTAWHARQANARSIGIEVAHVGAHPPGEEAAWRDWYARDAQGLALRLPPGEEHALRTPGFRGRPARPEPVRGELQGTLLVQADFTPEQYASLAALAASLSRVFPRLALDAPRDAAGRVRTGVLDDSELAGFAGVVGHHHVSADKVDPGPAFDWERFLAEARRRRALERPMIPAAVSP